MQFRISDQHLYAYKLFFCSSIQWRIVKTNLERAWKEARSVISILFACNVARIIKRRVAVQLQFNSLFCSLDSLDSMKNCKDNGTKWTANEHEREENQWFLLSISSTCNVTKWIIRKRYSSEFQIIFISNHFKNYFFRRFDGKL